MTREQAVNQFARMQANWTFLDMADETTFEVWFQAFEMFEVGEVSVGISEAMKVLKSQPTVAEILEFVHKARDGRRRQRDEELRHNLNLMRNDAIHCQECHDVGYQLIEYPGDHEYIRPCPKRCETALKMFGKEVWLKIDSGKYGPSWADIQIMLSADSEQAAKKEWRQYKEVEAQPEYVTTGKTYRINDKEHPIKRKVYMPGPRATSGTVFRMYVKK